MSRQLYLTLYHHILHNILPTIPKPWDVQSGGAAWADHVAVSLFLAKQADSLTLYLPAPLDDGETFLPTYDGRINYYHSIFSKAMGASTIDGIQRAIKLGARVEIVEGFHNRNLPVGKCDVLIASTFGEGDQPKDGGTSHTWTNSPAPIKIHVPIASLMR